MSYSSNSYTHTHTHTHTHNTNTHKHTHTHTHTHNTHTYQSGRGGTVMEDEQRVVQQQQLIADLWSHRSHHCHAFTTPHDAVSQIATALLGMARTDFAAPASSHRHTHVNPQRAHTPPFGTCHVQAALRGAIALDPPLLPSQVGCVLLLTHSNSLI